MAEILVHRPRQPQDVADLRRYGRLQPPYHGFQQGSQIARRCLLVQIQMLHHAYHNALQDALDVHVVAPGVAASL